MCFDGKERLCNIRGKMRKKVWIGVGDIVLLGLRDFQDEKADVIQKYNPDEARRLKAQGHIPDNIQLDAEGGDKVAPQPQRAMPGAGGYIQGLSDIDDSEEDDSSEEESDEEEEDDYYGAHAYKASSSYNKATAN